MAQLADVTYRFPAVDEWTNLAFLLPLLAGLSAWEQLVLVPALGVLCVGSWLWHRWETRRSVRVDELGMMMTFSASMAVLVARATGTEPLVLLALPVWALYYRYLHKTSSFRHFAYWAAPILGMTAYIAGPAAALVPFTLMLAGLIGQFGLVPWRGPRHEHGVRHGLTWHVPEGAALWSVFALTSPAGSWLLSVLQNLA